MKLKGRVAVLKNESGVENPGEPGGFRFSSASRFAASSSWVTWSGCSQATGPDGYPFNS